MTDFPVLRIRATNPVTADEATLDGVDLLALRVTAISVDMGNGVPATATLTFHVTPDLELPAGILAHVVDPTTQ